MSKVTRDELLERFKWLRKEVERLETLEQKPIVVDAIRMYGIQMNQIVKYLDEGEK